MRHRLVLLAPALLSVLALTSCTGIEEDPVSSAEGSVRTVCGNTSHVFGIDVSEFQGTVDWGAVRARGNDFAIARIGDGRYEDPQFPRNWRGMKAAGLIRGAYHFFRAGVDPVAQAEIVIRHVGRLGDGDLPVTADVELSDGFSGAHIAANLGAFMNRVQAGTGKKPMIYTAGFFWESSVGSSAFADHPLWVAHWGVNCPNVPQAWRNFRFWQYSTTGGTLDRDVFNGTLAELRAFAGGGPAAGGGDGGGDAGGDGCPFGDGLYCGGNHVGGDPLALYQCTAGELTRVRSCDLGCARRPAGEDDRCKRGDRCPYGDGLYCGGNGVGGAPGTLYRCAGGELTRERVCQSGCAARPPGEDDDCR